MDKDNGLNAYVVKLLETDIDCESFENHIQLLSIFIAHTNLDYRYNGTYLSNYIEEIREVRDALQGKHGKYSLIFEDLCSLHQEFEVEMDNTYGGSYKIGKRTKKGKGGYIGINKEKIKSQNIEISIRFLRNDKVFLHYKKYNAENCNLRLDIIGDAKKFIEKKGLEVQMR